MTLVIIAAGLGSRYGGLKQIDPVSPNGEFIIDYSVYDALRAGFNRAVIIIKEENLDDFRETIGTRISPYIDVDYAFQSLDRLPDGFVCPGGRCKPWGTGQALLSACNAVHEPFAVINADDFYGRDAFSVLAAHLKSARTVNGVSECCMVGYRLDRTLTENGSVSRGQCFISPDGMLENITERTKIWGGVSPCYDEDGIKYWLEPDTVVSMNCFGLLPEVFPHIKKYFVDFLTLHIDEPKTEFYLPDAVKSLITNRNATVRVLPTVSQWYGVTYREDKPKVSAAVAQMIAAGEYPEKLWR